MSERRESNEWARLIIGSDVDRYYATPSKWVRENVPGIRYKGYGAPTSNRVLVRKTGIGLRAALGPDLTYFSNQVVFHLEPRSPDLSALQCAYVVGVLNSRVLAAYHMARTGEVAWRSHPYLTQGILAGFPIPLPEHGSRAFSSVEQIGELARGISLGIEDSAKWEVRIEELVAGLFNLGADDLEVLTKVLDRVEGVSYSSVAREIRLSEIRPAPAK